MTRICSIDGCGKKRVARCLCIAHYRMLMKHGDPLLKASLTPGTVRKWLTSHADEQNEIDCLIFPYGKNRSGYGTIGFDGFYMAHQWMCHEAHGPAPDGKPFALHSCGNGTNGCVNPNHLYWGDGRDNYRDQVEHGVVAIGERNGKSKLDRSAIIAIRDRRSSGETYREIAASYGVHKDTIRAVVSGKAWAWL